MMDRKKGVKPENFRSTRTRHVIGHMTATSSLPDVETASGICIDSQPRSKSEQRNVFIKRENTTSSKNTLNSTSSSDSLHNEAMAEKRKEILAQAAERNRKVALAKAEMRKFQVAFNLISEHLIKHVIYLFTFKNS